MQRTYLSAAETAKLVRAALKREFPSVKFSVRSKTYAGGASIDVGWTDGPTVRMVERIAKAYQGGAFDGMIDLKVNRECWLLPDGRASHASTDGTSGSGGVIPAKRDWMPHPEAKLVAFGADFVFCARSLSPAFERQLFARLARRGIEEAAGVESMDAASRIHVRSHGEYLSTLAHREQVRLVIAPGA